MAGKTPFHSLYSHGFVRAAVCLPEVHVASPRRNAGAIERLLERAEAEGAAMALFPELCLSAYSNEDLFHQEALLEASLEALARLIEKTRDARALLIAGAPLRLEGHLFNCAVLARKGRLLGVVPKSYLPNYREFYERRQFTPGGCAPFREAALLGQRVPFGSDLVFEARDVEGLRIHVEICEDLWVPVPPSSLAALGGATVLCNLSASNITIGKAEYRRELARSQSGRCVAAYLYAAAGAGESTTDLAWDGHAMVAENGTLLAESERFARAEQVITADIDLGRLLTERMRWTSFADAAAVHGDAVRALRRVPFDLEPPREEVPLRRKVERFPYVPSEASALDERCAEAYNIQVHGLVGRLASCGLQKAVIGVSGGLDSTHALVVVARAMDRLGLPRSNILAYSLPGFATSDRTRTNAHALMKALGATGAEIDIRPSCEQMLRDIGHPFADGRPQFDVTFENVQAGQRTSILFRLANHLGGLVVGTSDLSELALGWCTYGVGDHMSHYAVNASVPKTLIQHLLRWEARRGELGEETARILESILDTEISPELVPGSGGGRGDGGDRGNRGNGGNGGNGGDGGDGGDGGNGGNGGNGGDGGDGGQPVQSTERVIGPYELQDFHLYYTTRYGFLPSKVAFLCHHAWGDRKRGSWPAGLREDRRREYDLATIKRWLEVFLRRFFEQSQFKRSALPNGPKVGSGGSLSPRADWRAPSDAAADAWLEELRLNVPDH